MHRRMLAAALAITVIGPAAVATAATTSSTASGAARAQASTAAHPSSAAAIYERLMSRHLLQRYSTAEQTLVRRAAPALSEMYARPSRARTVFGGLSAADQKAVQAVLGDNDFYTNTSLALTPPCFPNPSPACVTGQVPVYAPYVENDQADVDDGEGQDVYYNSDDPTQSHSLALSAAATEAKVAKEQAGLLRVQSTSGCKSKYHYYESSIFGFIVLVKFTSGTYWCWSTPKVSNCTILTPSVVTTYPWSASGEPGQTGPIYTPNNGSCIHIATQKFVEAFTAITVHTVTTRVSQTLGNNGSSINHAHAEA